MKTENPAKAGFSAAFSFNDANADTFLHRLRRTYPVHKAVSWPQLPIYSSPFFRCFCIFLRGAVCQTSADRLLHSW